MLMTGSRLRPAGVVSRGCRCSVGCRCLQAAAPADGRGPRLTTGRIPGKGGSLQSGRRHLTEASEGVVLRPGVVSHRGHRCSFGARLSTRHSGIPVRNLRWRERGLARGYFGSGDRLRRCVGSRLSADLGVRVFSRATPGSGDAGATGFNGAIAFAGPAASVRTTLAGAALRTVSWAVPVSAIWSVEV